MPLYSKKSYIVTYKILFRFVNTSCEEITFQLTETLGSASKNISIWESSTIHRLVSMAWIFTLCLAVQEWMWPTDEKEQQKLVNPIVWLKRMPWNGSRPNTMELFLTRANRKKVFCAELRINWYFAKLDKYSHIVVRLYFWNNEKL